MRNELIQRLRLPPTATDEQIIEAVGQQRAFVAGSVGTTFANLDEHQLGFVLRRIEKGWELGRAMSVGAEFCALSEADQGVALAKEKAGLKLEDAIVAILAQATQDAQAGQS